MEKTIKLILFFFIFIVLAAAPANASTIAGTSAAMQNLLPEKTIFISDNSDINYARKRAVIRSILEKHNSPLVDQTDSFIDTCKTYNIDCYLLPSITGLESSFGKYTYPGSNNPFGWGGGYIMFKDWNVCIHTVGQGLRENYINKGATDVEQIGRIYAASPTWAVRVTSFMGEFQAEEQKKELFFTQNTVKL